MTSRDPSRKSGPLPKGRVVLLGAGPGDPDLITWRGHRLLQKADVVLYDALSHPELLKLCKPGAELFDVGKRYGKRATPQAEITKQLLELGRSGQLIVRLKGGDPLLFARGSEEALALAEAGIPFEIVPGVTSPVAAAAFSGIPLTHRDLSSSVTFITGSDREGKEWSPEAWKKLATATGTICVFMGMRRIRDITQAIIDGGRSPETPAAVVRWGGRPQQRTLTSTLCRIADEAQAHDLTSPAIIIVGEVVSLREQLRWYDTGPLYGRKLVIPRPEHQAEETSRRVRERSAIPLLCPAIEIHPSPDPERVSAAVSTAGSYDWVVFTSRNGVTAFFEEAYRQGKDARIFASARVAVIGEKTGAALAPYGIRADLTATEYVAESLVSDLKRELQGRGRVLLFRALVARDTLPDALRESGVVVDVVPAYQTSKVTGERKRALKETLAQEAEVLLLTSSSMVDSVAEALGDEAEMILQDVVMASVGPITSGTVRKYGWRVDVEATTYTVDGLLDALEAYFSVPSV